MFSVSILRSSAALRTMAVAFLPARAFPCRLGVAPRWQRLCLSLGLPDIARSELVSVAPPSAGTHPDHPGVAAAAAALAPLDEAALAKAERSYVPLAFARRWLRAQERCRRPAGRAA